MKTPKQGAALFISLLLYSYILHAQNKELYTIGSDYTITIEGSSNLHDWSETIEEASGKSIILQNKNGSIDLNSLTMSMDARSVNSPEGKLMANKTRDALKTDRYPFITFSLDLPLTIIPFDAAGTTLNTSGKLTIAGVTRAVTISGKIYRIGIHKFIFEGIQSIRMSDYNITPPIAMLGILKVSDKISVHYRTIFEIKS